MFICHRPVKFIVFDEYSVLHFVTLRVTQGVFNERDIVKQTCDKLRRQRWRRMRRRRFPTGATEFPLWARTLARSRTRSFNSVCHIDLPIISSNRRIRNATHILSPANQLYYISASRLHACIARHCDGKKNIYQQQLVNPHRAMSMLSGCRWRRLFGNRLQHERQICIKPKRHPIARPSPEPLA